MDLPWRTVWITGASTGIGEALARRLDGRGAHVAASARSADKLGALSQSAKNVGSYPLDVTDAAASHSVVAQIEATSGPVDLAVLNAGTWSPGRFDALDLETLERSFRVNYMGVVNGLKAVLPGMIARGAGHVAIVASVAGYRGLPNASSYGPTKAALINLAETLRLELEGSGVTISIVNPGFVDTPMTAKNDFAMPDLMQAADAAAALEKGLVARRYEIAFPWRFTRVMKLLRILPHWAFFPLARRLV